MEYTETRIHKKEEVMANRRPKASTLDPKLTCENTSLKKWLSTLFPARIAGAMERMIPNCSKLAIKVQLSRRLGRLRHSRIRIAAEAGHARANMGRYDLRISIMAF
jgi:hypothetical protein